MALTDFFTQIADSIRSKDGTTEPIVATDFPQRILDIPSGGSGLPSNIKTGTFTVAEDTTETITIPHGVGTVPIKVYIFPDNPEYVVGNIPYAYLGSDSAYTLAFVTTNASELSAKYNLFTMSVDETNITIANANATYKFIAGLTYRWFAWGTGA